MWNPHDDPRQDPLIKKAPVGGAHPESQLTAPFQAQIDFQAAITAASTAAAQASARYMGDVVRELAAMMNDLPRVFAVELVANAGNAFSLPYNPQRVKMWPMHGTYALDRISLLRRGGPLASSVDVLVPFFADPLTLSVENPQIDLGLVEIGGFELQFCNNDPANKALVLVRFKRVWSPIAWQDEADQTP